MFTGIIRHTGVIRMSRPVGQGRRWLIETTQDVIDQMEVGITSVAVDGSCHTVEKLDGLGFEVYSSDETLKRTTLGQAKLGSVMNLELPLTLQTLLDGHLVQGHVDGMGRIITVENRGESRRYRFEVPRELRKYLVEKDSIAIDGISLTLFNISGSTFSVAVIPETIRNTSLSAKKAGSRVNLEVNLFAKYADRFNGDREKHLTEWIK